MISVLITNYNKEKYIKETLDSCLKQSNKDFEIIFYDDNSTDNSFKLAKSILNGQTEINFKILERQNKKSDFNSLNQISAVLESLKHCQGRFISFLDADDIFKNDKIEKTFENIKKEKKILYNSYHILKKNILEKNYRHFKIRKFLWPIFPPTSCLTIEKNLLEEILSYINFSDYPSCWLDFRIALYVSKYYKSEIIYDKKELNIYRISESGNDKSYKNILSTLFWSRKLDAIRIFKMI